MKNKEASFVSKYGSSVNAVIEKDDTITVTIEIPTDEEEIMKMVVSAYLPAVALNIAGLDQVIKSTVLPFVFDLYISDPILRIQLYYEFGMVDVIENDNVDVAGDYYIAVEKVYDFEGEDVSKLVLIGTCPDGSSYFTPDSALSAYKLLDAHSVDECGLPLLEEHLVRPYKFVLFRMR